MGSIYDIDRELLALIDEETGEIADFEAFESLQMQRDEKIEGAACWIKELEYQAACIKEEEKALAARRKAAENRAKRLREYVGTALAGSKFETPRCKISYRKSVSLEIADGAVIPEDYTHVEYKVDKAGLKAAVKAGLEIEGVALVEKQNMQVK